MVFDLAESFERRMGLGQQIEVRPGFVAVFLVGGRRAQRLTELVAEHRRQVVAVPR
ncbi:MAG: hypothetical protein AAGJ38_08735 [Planctomycetota bacterium]